MLFLTLFQEYSICNNSLQHTSMFYSHCNLVSHSTADNLSNKYDINLWQTVNRVYCSGRRDCDRMVVAFTTTCAISTYNH